MTTGTIVKWSGRRGIGFIRPDDASDDGVSGNCFVHYSASIGGRKLALGMRVSFEIVETSKGLRAENVSEARRGA